VLGALSQLHKECHDQSQSLWYIYGLIVLSACHVDPHKQVFGWIPTQEPGGEVGLGVKASFQHERDQEEGQEDEAVAARLGGGHAPGDSAHGDAAKEASAKMARLREAQARAAREKEALEACGELEYTLNVLEATPGGAAAKAGLIGGQRISAVN